MRNIDKRIKQLFLGIAAICFWILVWNFLAEEIDSRIFLPTPKDTFYALINLSRRDEFWQTIFNSFSRIVKGFILAVVCGLILAVVSSFCKIIGMLLAPLMKLIKAVPVASFIILALLWIDSKNLSVLISFIMVLPVIYINVLQAFRQVDNNMLEMAKVFRVSVGRSIRFIYLPCVLPAFISACKIGLGFCFKSGIAAEVIGLPAKSIGGELYKSKLYLMTDELFAWTVVIILMSVFFEGICIYILNRLSVMAKKVHRVHINAVSGQGAVNVNCAEIQTAGEHVRNMAGERDSDTFSVELNEISKSFGRQCVLKNVNLVVRSGSPKCIMGISGVGKTTLLKVLLGLLKPDSGQVIVPAGKRISAVFQEDRLIEDADVYTNIYCVQGRAFDRRIVDKHLEMTGLIGTGEKLINELSGGMKRRIAVIRAVLVNPDILVLDEAFKGLDDESRDIVIQYIRKCCGNKVIILVSHDREEGEKMGADITNLNDINEVKVNVST